MLAAIGDYFTKVPAATVVALVILVGGVKWLTSCNGNNGCDSAGRKRRSMSFSSEILIHGAFPEKARCHQSVVSVMFYVTKCPPVERIHEQLKKMLFFNRFRSGLTRTFFSWMFTDLGIDSGVEKMVVETIEYNSEEEIRIAMDSLAVHPFKYEPSKPIWTLIRMVNKGSGRSALFFKLHHAMGDGIALVGMMPTMFEQANGEPFALDIPEKMGGGSTMKLSLGFIGRFFRSLIEVLTVAASKYDNDISFAPSHSAQYFYQEKTAARKCVTIRPIRLDFIKALKNKADGTVNDVLMTATAGMMRRYSLLKKDPAIPTMKSKTNLQTRALLAVAFPRSKKEMASPSKALKNNFSMISMPLAVNETNPVDRLKASKKITAEAKNSPTAILQMWVQTNLISLMPRFMQQQIAFDAFTRHSVVFSNVPGPADPIYFCGEKLLDVHVVFPNLLNQIIMISYAGFVHFTMSADAKEIDAEAISICFCQELQELAKELGVNADMF